VKEKCLKTLLNIASDGADVTCDGRLFQKLALDWKLSAGSSTYRARRRHLVTGRSLSLVHARTWNNLPDAIRDSSLTFLTHFIHQKMVAKLET